MIYFDFFFLDVKELCEAASSGYNLSQLLASSCFECLLVGSKFFYFILFFILFLFTKKKKDAKENEQVAEALRVICENENSLRLLSLLCVNESYEVSLSASRALLSIFQSKFFFFFCCFFVFFFLKFLFF